MDLSIRKYIINNFKDGGKEALEESIKESIKKGEEITLPGLGVLFEILWNNSDDNSHNQMLDTILNNLK